MKGRGLGGGGGEAPSLKSPPSPLMKGRGINGEGLEKIIAEVKYE
jgi:hypothetical protein